MNKLLTALALVVISLPTMAAEVLKETQNTIKDIKVKLGGSMDTQVGYVHQKSFFTNTLQSDITKNKAHSTALANNTKLTINIDGDSLHGFKYGGFIKLNADTSVNIITGKDNIAEKVYIYFESNRLGRIEAGGNDIASDQLGVGAESLAKATGGIRGDGKAKKWYANYAYYPNPDPLNVASKKFTVHFLNTPGLPMDIDYNEYLSKVSYFTPKFNGLQFGISYLVDTSLNGTVAVTHTAAKVEDKGFKNAFTPSVKYETKMNDIEFKTALTSQFAEAKQQTPALVRHGINAWALGATAKYNGIGIGGSYGDWKKSGTVKIKQTGRQYGTSYWTAGASYEKGKFGTSLTYMSSKTANSMTDDLVLGDDDALTGVYKDYAYNRYTQLSLGLEYKLFPGLMPYLEVTDFKAKQARAALSNGGTVFLTGVKLSF